jgi:hypothetical protein
VETPEVVACPILEFWVDGPNQPYESMPAVDCDRAAVGERADDGTWTFDLGIIAADWLDLDSGIDPNGVALLPAPETTGTFQVVFEGESAQIDLQTSGGSDLDDPFGTPGADAGGFDLDLGSDVAFDSDFGGGGGSFDGGGFSSPDLGTGDVSFDPVDGADPGATPDDGAAGDAAGSGDDPESAAPVASRSPMGLGELPGAVWLLLPAALVLAGVTSYALGPAGEPPPRRAAGPSPEPSPPAPAWRSPDAPPSDPPARPAGRHPPRGRLRAEARRGHRPDRWWRLRGRPLR